MSEHPVGAEISDTVRFELDSESIGGRSVAIITIDRPAKLNALNQHVLSDLSACLDRAETDDSVAGVIVTGSGEKSFVAGADISEFVSLTPESARLLALSGQQLFSRIAKLSKPVLAAVNGYALGGGCELALACHMRFASENALFGQPEVGLGLIPGYGGTQRLPRIVGHGRAMEMILSGSPVGAQRAFEIGLVNKVVPGSELLQESLKLMRKIAAQAPIAVALSLTAISAADGPLTTGLEYEAALFGQAFTTEDFQEGTTAFLEKRRPTFRGQ